MGLSFIIAAVPRQRSHSQVRIPQDSWSNFTLSDSRLPNLEGQVPVFISHRNRVAQLYPQALGSIFVASYDSQAYGGGFVASNAPAYNISARTTYKTPFFFCCVGVRCRGSMFTEPLLRNELHNPIVLLLVRVCCGCYLTTASVHRVTA
jgi:hypothetical protein